MVITNPDSGSWDQDVVEGALDVLKAGADVDVRATADSDALGSVLEGRSGRDVVVVGGDGSLHAVVQALHRRGDLAEPVLGLIPLGTGNDLARTLEIPLDPSDAARLVLDGTARPLDILVADDDSVVVNATHVGVGADAGRAAESWKSRLGKVGYLVGALIAGLQADGLKIRVVGDDRAISSGRRRVLQVGIGNGRYVGGGTPLTPDAIVDDGFADLIVSFAVSPVPRLVYAVRLRLGRQGESPEVTTARVRRVSIEGELFSCNTDGELELPVHRRTWVVRPGAYRMVLASTTTDGRTAASPGDRRG